jgi:hypothetical protein
MLVPKQKKLNKPKILCHKHIIVESIIIVNKNNDGPVHDELVPNELERRVIWILST